MNQQKSRPDAPLLANLSDADIDRYAGQWVAVKDDAVLFASEDPAVVFEWLRERDMKADLLFRLPAKDDPKIWIL